MSEKGEFYRMTSAERQAYVTMLLFPGGEQQALAYRDERDAYWRAHPEEWEKVKLPADAPVPLL